jgi:menaquinone-specific isochorismate synthase
MSVVRIAREVETISEAIAALNEQVLHTVARRRMDQQELVRVEVALKPFDALAWLASQRSATKYYWRHRESGTEYAGIGAVETVEVNASADLHGLVTRIARQETDSHVRWFGGLPFDLERPRGAESAGFAAGRFVLPGIDIEMTGDSATLACNVTIQDANLYSRLACLSDIDPTIWNDDWPTTVVERRELPGPVQWNKTVIRILHEIQSGPLTKLVPARSVTLDLTSPLDPWLAVARLKAQGGALTLFAFQFGENAVFIGATPERLFKRTGTAVESEAIAGTIPRGTNSQQDADRAGRLLASDKDRREHRLVVDFLREGLEPLAESINVGGTDILKLPQLQHLRTPIHASLRGSVSDADLLEVLHPTPAVAGVPKDLSVQLIREIEPFDRGWYAGAVGWINRSSSEFAVAIRSLVVAGNSLLLTAGAGIVEGSDPRAEWDETEQKIRSTLDIILP